VRFLGFIYKHREELHVEERQILRAERLAGAIAPASRVPVVADQGDGECVLDVRRLRWNTANPG
jgi:hypothetical protein